LEELLMRHDPDPKFDGLPCSVVGTGTAYEYLTGSYFSTASRNMPYGLKPDGYLSLDLEDKYIRRFLTVKRKKYYKKDERMTLSDFLLGYKGPAAICVLGHFLFAVNGDYWSFFDNELDEVVCVWYL
jgi:hypothetical protein